MAEVRPMQQATPEQLGHATRPELHTATAAVMYDEHEDEFPAAESPTVRTPAELMRWRARPSLARAPGPATEDTRPVDHASQGRPDARRVWDALAPAGYPGASHEALRPDGPERITNTRYPAPTAPAAAPVRYRGGGTSETPGRPALWWGWLFVRPFDQWAAHHPPALAKIEHASPMASTPRMGASGVAHAYPSPGGSGPLFGIGPEVQATPNSYRIMPRPWDELLITVPYGPEDAVSSDSVRRAGGWRLRG